MAQSETIVILEDEGLVFSAWSTCIRPEFVLLVLANLGLEEASSVQSVISDERKPRHESGWFPT
jgi:hypothetical protein